MCWLWHCTLHAVCRLDLALHVLHTIQGSVWGTDCMKHPTRPALHAGSGAYPDWTMTEGLVQWALYAACAPFESSVLCVVHVTSLTPQATCRIRQPWGLLHMWRTGLVEGMRCLWHASGTCHCMWHSRSPPCVACSTGSSLHTGGSTSPILTVHVTCTVSLRARAYCV